MSTDIKPGQVWVWAEDGEGEFIIASLDGDMAGYKYSPTSERTYHTPQVLIREKATLVKDVDATPAPLAWDHGRAERHRAVFDTPQTPTPAPLDPRKVKAGDTVTAQVDLFGEHSTPKPFEVTGEVWADYGDNPHGPVLRVGPYSLDSDTVTLTDHRPAPEPEPEWDSDADYVATVRGVPGLRVTWSPVDDSDRAPWRTRKGVGDGKWSWHEDRYVTDVRPLVVIDPAAVDVDALVEEYSNALNDTMTHDYRQHERRAIAMRAALAKLGIEAP